ncbi:hypothetical protein [Gottfriedia acidiceleris]|nr:hypothetical protein [Gottfriedia acidiceleris]
MRKSHCLRAVTFIVVVNFLKQLMHALVEHRLAASAVFFLFTNC